MRTSSWPTARGSAPRQRPTGHVPSSTVSPMGVFVAIVRVVDQCGTAEQRFKYLRWFPVPPPTTSAAIRRTEVRDRKLTGFDPCSKVNKPLMPSYFADGDKSVFARRLRPAWQPSFLPDSVVIVHPRGGLRRPFEGGLIQTEKCDTNADTRHRRITPQHRTPSSAAGRRRCGQGSLTRTSAERNVVLMRFRFLRRVRVARLAEDEGGRPGGEGVIEGQGGGADGADIVAELCPGHDDLPPATAVPADRSAPDGRRQLIQPEAA